MAKINVGLVKKSMTSYSPEEGKKYALIHIQYFHLLMGLSNWCVPLNLSFSLRSPMVERPTVIIPTDIEDN